MNKDVLIQAGIEYDEGMHRFCDNAAMYEKYLRKLTGLPLMEELKQTMGDKAFSEAFKICHKLKAFVGNLSIPALYEEICELTEILRTESINEESAERQFLKTEKVYQNVMAVLTEEISHE